MLREIGINRYQTNAMKGQKRKKLKSDDPIKKEDDCDVKSSNYVPPGFLSPAVGTLGQVHTIPLHTIQLHTIQLNIILLHTTCHCLIHILAPW